MQAPHVLHAMGVAKKSVSSRASSKPSPDVAAGRDQDPVTRRGDVGEPLHGSLLRARRRTE
jgi:hypothetical protein